jgi:hypothetical protein
MREEQLVRAVGELDVPLPRDLEPIEALEPTAEELQFLATWMQAVATKVQLAAMQRLED